EQVGVHDNFFDIGGDSILSIQIVTRANQAGARITPQDLFQHQTVAQLSRIARPAAATQAEQARVVGPVLLTPAQRWYFEPNPADPYHFNQAILVPVSPGFD